MSAIRDWWKSARLVIGLAAVLLLGAGAVARAQDDESESGDDQATEEGTAEQGVVEGVAPGPSPEASAKIDEILEGEESVLEGLSTSYDPGGRRDPFRSLLQPARARDRGPRPPGTAGFLIDEISIKGIFRTSSGFVAHIDVQNQKKSFLLREGDPVYDGDVLRIDQHTVVFRQIVNDPTIIKPFREVVKKLRP